MSAPLFASPSEAGEWARQLPEGTPGREYFEYAEIAASTQDSAFDAAARGIPAGAVFVAEEQRVGRGRQGRAWSAAPGSSLLLSILQRAPARKDRTGRMALGAALAVCRAVEAGCGVSPQVKWPNDLMLEGAKCGGILVEVRGEPAVTGIGLNVLQGGGDFPAELAGQATSLVAGGAGAVDRRALLRAVLVEMGAMARQLESGWDDMIRGLKARLAWRGEHVRAGNVGGVLRDLSPEGFVLIETSAGAIREVASGRLELAAQ